MHVAHLARIWVMLALPFVLNVGDEDQSPDNSFSDVHNHYSTSVHHRRVNKIQRTRRGALSQPVLQY